MAAQGNDHSRREAILAGLLEEIHQRLLSGQPVDVEVYDARYPAYGQELRRLLPILDDLTALGPAKARKRTRRDGDQQQQTRLGR